MLQSLAQLRHGAPEGAFLVVIHNPICRGRLGEALEVAGGARLSPKLEIFPKKGPARQARFLSRKTAPSVAPPQPLRDERTSARFCRRGCRRHVHLMARPRRFPEKGDVSTAMVAERLGITVAEFESVRIELAERGFPTADPTTRRYAVEAVDVWRLRRYPPLFPALSATPQAADAGAVFHDRMRRLRG